MEARADFSSEIMEARTLEHNTFKMMKKLTNLGIMQMTTTE